jgi:hypothetical protein
MMAVDPAVVPLHRRTLEFDVFDSGDSVRVAGRLKDLRPWAEDQGRMVVHDMELDLEVRRSDLVILAAQATMHTFPHAECTDIENAFAGLVGVSIGRGYTKAVTDRFVGVLGCSHLEHLARSLGPAVIQAVASGYSKQYADGILSPPSSRPTGAPWLKNTCHIWAEGGIGEQKVALGGFPSDREEYPVPPLEVLVRRRETRRQD